MPPTGLDIKAANMVVILLEFSWGATPSIERYCAFTSDVTYKGNTYAAVPGIEIKYGKQTGTTENVPAEIVMKVLSPLTQMRGTFPPVAVTIIEMRPNTDSTAVVMWKGKIGSVAFNYQGNAGVCKVLVDGTKRGLQTTISLRLGRFCQNVFGMNACKFDLEANKDEGVVAAVDGQKITFTGLTDINIVNRWQFGSVTVDGFAISIYSHDLGTQVFHLTKPAPAYWVGLPAKLYVGCDQSIERCRVLGQESQYNGIGVKIPNREVRINP